MSNKMSWVVEKGEWVIAPGVRPAEDSGILWLNPFTGELEAWHNTNMAVSSQLRAAAERINSLQEQVDALKASLTNPTTGK